LGESGQDQLPLPVETVADDAETAAPPVKATRTRRTRARAAEPAPEPQLTAAVVDEDDEASSEDAAGLVASSVAVAGPVGSATAPVSAEPDVAEAETPPTRSRRRAAAPISAVLFMPPSEQTPPPVAARRDEIVPAATLAEDADGDEDEAPRAATTRRRRSRRTSEEVAVEPVEEIDDVITEDAEAGDDEDEFDGTGRRRRRRGRRGRGRGRGVNGEELDDVDEATPVEAGADDETAEAGDEDGDGDPLTRRRTRRRRRKGSADVEQADDPHVVVKIREPRGVVTRDRDEVQGVSGSTRLEAKRQRRRDGREQRRSRPPILSESEFLARREAVDRTMVIRQKGDRTQIAVLEDKVLVEHYVTRATSATMVGNVYLGRVQNVLPSMEAAFVDIGRGRNAVLYAGEVNWDATGLEGRTRTIEQALRSGDSVLVQVTKDPIGTKGARLTSHIALSGRHLVYVPNGNASGISRKLSDVERKRLRDTLKHLIPDNAGVIVRTAAEGASEDDLASDVKRLQAQWETIQEKAGGSSAPALLYEEPDLVIRVVRDLFNEDFRELVIQGSDSYDMVEDYLSHISPDLVSRVRRHTGTGDVFVEQRVDEQLIKALDRRVFLPSGGHLVIDRTEAMTVVDVNTGKYTGAGGNLEETVTRNNLEAAEEIVHQLRLRDIGGIIVIDFIDMVLESNRDLVLRRLTECLGRDRTKHQVTEITSLGLVQMTRKRVGQGLLEAFSETCEVCKGRGLIIHTEPVLDKRHGSNGSHGNGSERAAVAKVAAATSAAVTATEEADSPVRPSRRRGRRGSSSTAEAADEVLPDAVVGAADQAFTVGAADQAFTVGAADQAEDTDYAPAEVDALDEDDSEDDDAAAGASRRRTRRGGVRRRTRP
jgi:ribonuclease E